VAQGEQLKLGADPRRVLIYAEQAA
jgi:hypothetical protein